MRASVVIAEVVHPGLRRALAVFDRDKDGVLDPSEVEDVKQFLASLKAEQKPGTIDLCLFPVANGTRAKLGEVFDKDGNGTVDAAELAGAAERFKETKRRTGMKKRAAGVAVVALLVLVGIAGCTTSIAARTLKDMAPKSSGTEPAGAADSLDLLAANGAGGEAAAAPVTASSAATLRSDTNAPVATQQARRNAEPLHPTPKHL